MRRAGISALVTNALSTAISAANRAQPRLYIPITVQFTSWAFTERDRASGLVPSIGAIGDCYDNGMMESFWGRMQTELLDRPRWKTRIELANAIFDYLEIFHNRQRRHSSLGMLTPNEYEMLRPTTLSAA
jgi:putative transposase